jgi:hypothetical protein
MTIAFEVGRALGVAVPQLAVVLVAVAAVRWLGKQGQRAVLWVISVLTGLIALLFIGLSVAGLAGVAGGTAPHVLLFICTWALFFTLVSLMSLKYARAPR